MLVQMMKAMQRHGCTDFTLTQQAEQLLRDGALQDYPNAFAPDKKSQGCSKEFVPEPVSKFQFYPKSITHDIISEPLQEHASVRARPAPVAPGLNEDLDTTQVRKTNVSVQAYVVLMTEICLIFWERKTMRRARQPKYRTQHKT